MEVDWAVLSELDKPRTPTRFDFAGGDVVNVCYWSVICDRPTPRACRKGSWLIRLRRCPLLSPATMSRRVRAPSVTALPDALERRVTAPKGPGRSG